MDTLGICKEINMKPGEVIINAADCHIYESHVPKASIYANRKKQALPKLKKVTTFSNFNFNEIEIENYNPDSRLEVKVYK